MLDLSLVPFWGVQHLQEYFDAGDGTGVACCAGKEALAFVFDNRVALKARGIYEAALVTAYTGVKTNWRGWSLDILEWMFNQGDRARLLESGEPLPPGESYTLYRGVAGVGKHRRASGMSWSSDLDKAIWFAARSALLGAANPAVYTTVAKRNEVYCYTNEGEEHDFILRAQHYEKVDIPPERMKRKFSITP